MNQEIISVTQTDGHVIQVIRYASQIPPIANLLLLHGMAEHYERYDHFANYLSNFGYNVYLYSHRGHGTHLQEDELGFFTARGGYRLVVSDAIRVLKAIKQQSPNLPLILMGHSMGSLITRNVIQEYQDLAGVIICGTANPPSIRTISGLFLSSLTGYRRNPRKKSPLMNHAMFGSSLYKKINTRTKMDWLSTDPKVIDKYLADPHCGFLCSKSFYHDLLMLTLRATNKRRICMTNTNIPILIISGNEDPVGGCGKEVARLIQYYKKKQYQIHSKLYPGLRHEILNEPSQSEIMNDIKLWLDHITK